jgi:flagellar hook-associated protein 1 FlgK
MPSILNVSLTGMLAFQRALEVTSHNIANASTPGYSRQISTFTSRTASGVGTLGAGTQISTIRRAYDALQVQQLRTSATAYARLNSLSNLAGRVDTLLADIDTGLNAGLQSFFSTVQDLANDPASVATRQGLIGATVSLASRFSALDSGLETLENEVNDRLELAVSEINRLSSSIAQLNEKVALASGGPTPPNDLLDQRDSLLLELSVQVSVSTITQDDGTLSIFIGAGQSLVLGGNARQLGVTGSEFDLTRKTIVYNDLSGSTPLDTASTGGNLGGLLEYRSRILDPARESLGQTAIALTQSLNAQHAAGIDLRGNLGGDLFAIASPTVLPSNANTGSGTALATIGDIGALTGADYVLEFDGASYGLTRVDDGSTVALTGSGTVLDPFEGAGMNIVVAGAPAAGDRLLLRSGHDAAASLQGVITDPQAIALAAPTRSSASLNNIGNASISPARTIDPTNPALFSNTLIEFTSPTTYSINGAGSFAYTDGDPIVVNGSEVSISGVPASGDRFTIQANFAASGDNSNALSLANIQNGRILDGGTLSIAQNYGRLVATVGAATHQIQSNLDAQGVVLTNAENAVLSLSAVNLDEEAANLIRYQQAYQAVAQVVSVASTLFDTLLNATRR